MTRSATATKKTDSPADRMPIPGDEVFYVHEGTECAAHQNAGTSTALGIQRVKFTQHAIVTEVANPRDPRSQVRVKVEQNHIHEGCAAWSGDRRDKNARGRWCVFDDEQPVPPRREPQVGDPVGLWLSTLESYSTGGREFQRPAFLPIPGTILAVTQGGSISQTVVDVETSEFIDAGWASFGDGNHCWRWEPIDPDADAASVPGRTDDTAERVDSLFAAISEPEG
jgi:hypothetical protein